MRIAGAAAGAGAADAGVSSSLELDESDDVVSEDELGESLLDESGDAAHGHAKARRVSLVGPAGNGGNPCKYEGVDGSSKSGVGYWGLYRLGSGTAWGSAWGSASRLPAMVPHPPMLSVATAPHCQSQTHRNAGGRPPNAVSGHYRCRSGH